MWVRILVSCSICSQIWTQLVDELPQVVIVTKRVWNEKRYLFLYLYLKSSWWWWLMSFGPEFIFEMDSNSLIQTNRQTNLRHLDIQTNIFDNTKCGANNWLLCEPPIILELNQTLYRFTNRQRSMERMELYHK